MKQLIFNALITLFSLNLVSAQTTDAPTAAPQLDNSELPAEAPAIDLSVDRAEIVHAQKHIGRMSAYITDNNVRGLTASHKVLVELLRWEMKQAQDRKSEVPENEMAAAAARLKRMEEILVGFDNFSFSTTDKDGNAKKVAIWDELPVLMQADLNMWKVKFGLTEIPETTEELQRRARM